MRVHAEVHHRICLVLFLHAPKVQDSLHVGAYDFSNDFVLINADDHSECIVSFQRRFGVTAAC